MSVLRERWGERGERKREGEICVKELAQVVMRPARLKSAGQASRLETQARFLH